MLRKLKEAIIINFKYFVASFKEIFKNPVYLVVAILSALALLITIISLPNHELIGKIIFGDVFTFKQKFKILFASLGAFETNFTTESQVLLLLIAGLVGVNVAMLAYYFRTRMVLQRAAGASVFGIAVSILGVGCSACGSVVISTLFGISTAVIIINFLPLKGIEFSLLSIVVIIGSIVYLAKRLQTPGICKVNVKKQKN